MRPGGLARTIDPGIRESDEDRRPGRFETVSPHLVLLPRSMANVDASAPGTAEMEGLHDNFDALRGIALSAALGASLWIVTGGVVWWFVR